MSGPEPDDEETALYKAFRSHAIGETSRELWKAYVAALDKRPVEEVVIEYLTFLALPGNYTEGDYHFNLARRESVIRRVGSDRWDELYAQAKETLSMVL